MFKWALFLALGIILSSCQQTAYNPGYIISDTQGVTVSEEN
jgi:hypothetical protein